MALRIPGRQTAGTFQEHIQSLILWETSPLANVQFTDAPFMLTSQIDPNHHHWPQLQMAQS